MEAFDRLEDLRAEIVVCHERAAHHVEECRVSAGRSFGEAGHDSRGAVDVIDELARAVFEIGDEGHACGPVRVARHHLHGNPVVPEAFQD